MSIVISLVIAAVLGVGLWWWLWPDTAADQQALAEIAARRTRKEGER